MKYNPINRCQVTKIVNAQFLFFLFLIVKKLNLELNKTKRPLS